MPVIKSAIKKLRKDKKRTVANNTQAENLKKAVKIATKTKKAKDIQKAFSALDKAVKKHLIHANRAARIKSRLANLDKKVPLKDVQTGTKPKKVQTPKKKSTIVKKKK